MSSEKSWQENNELEWTRREVDYGMLLVLIDCTRDLTSRCFLTKKSSHQSQELMSALLSLTLKTLDLAASLSRENGVLSYCTTCQFCRLLPGSILGEVTRLAERRTCPSNILLKSREGI